MYNKVPMCHRGVPNQKVILSKDNILALYNHNFEREHEDCATEIDNRVHTWILERAKEMGWPSALMDANIGLILIGGVSPKAAAGGVIHPFISKDLNRFPTVSETSSHRPVVAIPETTLLDLYNNYFDNDSTRYKRKVDGDVEAWVARRCNDLRWPTHMFTVIPSMTLLLSNVPRKPGWEETIEDDGHNVICVDGLNYAPSPTII